MREEAQADLGDIKDLNIENDVEITDFELSEFTNIYRTIEKYRPDEIYNLAANLCRCIF